MRTRKTQSSEGDDRPRKRLAHDNNKNLACPFYKRDPTHNMHCLYRNQLTSTSFVRQHILRYHCQEKKVSTCQFCSSTIEYETVERGSTPGTLKDGREYPCLCRLERLRDYKSQSFRRGTEEERWYSIWEALFPNMPRPSSLYIDSPEDEIIKMTLRAIQRTSPPGAFAQLQIPGSWAAVSSILEDTDSELPLNHTSRSSSYGSLARLNPRSRTTNLFQPPSPFFASGELDLKRFSFGGIVAEEESSSHYPVLGAPPSAQIGIADNRCNISTSGPSFQDKPHSLDVGLPDFNFFNFQFDTTGVEKLLT